MERPAVKSARTIGGGSAGVNVKALGRAPPNRDFQIGSAAAMTTLNSYLCGKWIFGHTTPLNLTDTEHQLAI